MWERFGDVPNYVEPFFGSGAVLLGRPTPARIETVNDADCYLANWWRAVQADPEGCARHADWPVNEADLHARHRWLVNQADFRERMKVDPDYFDVRIAGWWVWGICQWIGGGWCTAPEWRGRSGGHAHPRGIAGQGRQHPRGPDPHTWEPRPNLDGNGVHRVALAPIKSRGRTDGPQHARPALGDGGMGVHAGNKDREDGTPRRSRPVLDGDRGAKGVHRYGIGAEDVPQRRPTIQKGGHGVHRLSRQIPVLAGDAGAAGRGIHASALEQKRPRCSKGGNGVHRITGPGLGLVAWFEELQDRLRRVRVCCGDWKRILGPSPTVHIGVTAVFLDPPYSAAAGRDSAIYGAEDLEVAHDVRRWAIEHGNNPKLRIALCGYEGEHEMPAGWSKLAWTSQGGYGAQGRSRGRENRDRERIWFSQFCLPPRQPALFDGVEPVRLDDPTPRPDHE